MASKDYPVNVTNDYIKINFLGHQLKIGKVVEQHETFTDFIKSMDLDE